MNKKKNTALCSTNSQESINQKESTQLELFSQTPEKNTYSVVNFGEIKKLKQKLELARKSDQSSLNQQTILQISGQEIQKLETQKGVVMIFLDSLQVESRGLKLLLQHQT
jgi:hypothetical protein